MKLLIKRKADARSKNKAGKSAVDLAKHVKVKEALQEAVLHAQQQPSVAEQEAIDSQQQPGESGTAESSGREQAAVAIGPPERPASSVEQGAIGPPERPATSVQQEASDGQQDGEHHPEPEAAKRKRPDNAGNIVEVPAQTGHDTPMNRPSKAQKVNLSFAEDDEDG